MSPRRRRRPFIALVVALAALAAPAAASACEGQSFSQPFLPFADIAQYTAMPGGTFENSLGGWSLGSASVVQDNEPWQVSGSGHKALSIPPGTTVSTPAICTGIEHPSLRFFADRDGGTLLDSLMVTAIVHTDLGTLPVVVGPVVSTGTWAPSLPLVIELGQLNGLLQYNDISFQLTALGYGTWEIDDFYVDPWSRGG